MRFFGRLSGMSRRGVHRSRVSCLLLVILTAVVLAACSSARQTAIRVPSEPPLPQFETAPSKPGESSVWLPGFWDWSERDASWQWVSGRWEVPPRPGAVWGAPAHARKGTGWVLTRGGWN